MALVAYKGDLRALLEAGGDVIGQMDGSGNGFAGHADVEARVRRDAAELGATHVVFISSYDEEDSTPVQYQTTCNARSTGSRATADCTTASTGGVRFYRPHAGYTLIRVPARRLTELPVALGGDGRRARASARTGLRAPPLRTEPARASNGSPRENVATAPVEAGQLRGKIRQRCYEQAEKRFRATPDVGEPTVPTVDPDKSDDAATGWGARYAERKESGAPPPPEQETDREKAARWYRGCVARDGRQLAEAPTP